ncbi:MAG TPA: hypothetical protein VEV61_12065, partial [Streptosporangiaceae bacterium]|nr:hypothetical protein [Streptosporangiaceae bacterium]
RPASSSLVFDHRRRTVQRISGTARSESTRARRGGYFDTELVSDTWRKADVEVTQHFWRRPLAAIFDAFADAGFMVDRIAEPQPSAEALRLFPDDLGALVGVPLFIVYRLWLQP